MLRPILPTKNAVHKHAEAPFLGSIFTFLPSLKTPKSVYCAKFLYSSAPNFDMCFFEQFIAPSQDVKQLTILTCQIQHYVLDAQDMQLILFIPPSNIQVSNIEVLDGSKA